MKLHGILIIFLFINIFAVGQQNGDWQAVPIPLEAVSTSLPGELYYSENLDLVVYTGIFLDSTNTKFIAGYNGSEWEVLDDSVGGNFQTIIDYNQGFLVGGGTPYLGTQYIPHMAYFDGITWSYPWIFDNYVRKLLWVNGRLHALGSFNNIDGEPIQYAAVLTDNGVWESLIEPSSFNSTPHFYALEYYQGSYYISGNFTLANGIQDFARIEEGQLVQVGEGLTGSWTAVGNLNVYENELYLSGLIPAAQGNIGNHILKWDGQELQTVGSVFTDESGELNLGGSIAKTIVHNGYLLTAGAFQLIGSETITDIARWDGNQWCGFSGVWPETFFYRFEAFDNKLLMMQPYDEYNGQTIVFWKLNNIEDVDNCTEPLSIAEIAERKSLFVYPNPSSVNQLGKVQFEYSEPILNLSVLDLTGKIILGNVKPRNAESPQHFDLSGLNPGLYILAAETQSEIIKLKFIVGE